MKKILLAGAFAAVLVFAGVHFSFAAQPAVPGDDLQFKGAKKSVAFPHSAHTKGMECKTCHHAVQGKESYAKCASAGCHDDLVGKQGVKSLFAVAHGKNLAHQTCMECHKKTVEGAAERKKELTSCKGSKCHP